MHPSGIIGRPGRRHAWWRTRRRTRLPKCSGCSFWNLRRSRTCLRSLSVSDCALGTGRRVPLVNTLFHILHGVDRDFLAVLNVLPRVEWTDPSGANARTLCLALRACATVCGVNVSQRPWESHSVRSSSPSPIYRGGSRLSSPRAAAQQRAVNSSIAFLSSAAAGAFGLDACLFRSQNATVDMKLAGALRVLLPNDATLSLFRQCARAGLFGDGQLKTLVMLKSRTQSV
jgi:hypothetical protein